MAEPMAEVQKIVVGYDGGEGSEDALSLGKLLARLSGAQLIAAFVYRGGPAARPEAERLLRAGLRSLPYGQPAGFRAIEGDSPAAVLSDLADSTNALLVVAGTAAPGGDPAATEVMRELVRSAPCPIAFATRGFAATGGKALRRIGVCWDFTPASERALALANELALRANAQVRLYTASDPGHTTGYLPFVLDESAKDHADVLVVGPARSFSTYEQREVA